MAKRKKKAVRARSQAKLKNGTARPTNRRRGPGRSVIGQRIARMLAPRHLFEGAGAIGEHVGENGGRGARDRCVPVALGPTGRVAHRDARERQRARCAGWVRAVRRELRELDLDPLRDSAAATFLPTRGPRRPGEEGR